jgi:glycosyltransferase involved in cell wall biosynthesis
MQPIAQTGGTVLPGADTPQQTLRVIHIAKHCGYGNGNVHVAVDLACVQAQAGYEVTFVSGGGTFVEMLRQHGVRHVTMRQDVKKPAAMLRSAYDLVRLCRAERPHVVHAHMTAGAVLGYLATRLAKVALVTTVHNSFDPQSIVMRLGDRVVAVSNAERDNLIKKGYRRDTVMVVVNAPNRSPRESFMKNDREISLHGPCIAMICGLHHRKGVFDVIEAFSMVAADFPLWRLYIAGEGPDRSKLEAQTASLGLTDRIIFMGFVASPKALFQQLDIFVLASYSDPGSLSIGEARSAGCAIIATGVGGTPQMLDYGVAGRIVPPGAPQDLAKELRALMQDPALRAELGEAARKGAEAFDVEHLVDRYERVYRQMIGGPDIDRSAQLRVANGAT